MCTVVVGFDPDAPIPLLVVAVRDEMAARPWEEPGRHWPEHPGLVGGRDLQAGGTWLAVDPAAPRAAAVLNGWSGSEMPAAPGRPASRGALPLLAASGRGPRAGAELAAYAPFHLLEADTSSAVLHSWDGNRHARSDLPHGVSVLVNTGLDGAAPRAARYAPLFARHRPATGLDEAAHTPEGIWGRWPRLVNEAAASGARTAGLGPAPDDPSALVARAELGGGRLWATTSVTLLALAPGAVRYAFTDAPADPAAWRMVPVGSS